MYSGSVTHLSCLISQFISDLLKESSDHFSQVKQTTAERATGDEESPADAPDASASGQLFGHEVHQSTVRGILDREMMLLTFDICSVRNPNKPSSPNEASNAGDASTFC